MITSCKYLTSNLKGNFPPSIFCIHDKFQDTLESPSSLALEPWLKATLGADLPSFVLGSYVPAQSTMKDI